MSTLSTRPNGHRVLQHVWKPAIPSRREILWHSGFPARAFTTMVFMGVDLLALLLCYGIVCLFFQHDSSTKYWTFSLTFHPCILLSIVGFVVAGLYPGICLAPAVELRRYTEVSFIANGISLAFQIGFLRGNARHAAVYIVSWLISIPLLTGCRVAARALASHSGWWGVPAVVFGAGREGQALVDRLIKCRWIGYRPEILLDKNPNLAGNYRGVPVVADLSLGPKLATHYGYSTALIAMPNSKRAGSKDILLRYTKPFPTFILLTNHSKYLRLYTSIRDFEGSLGLLTTKQLLVPYNVVLKRILDLLGILVGGAVFLPVLLVLALLIKVDSLGPIFYCHRRLGKDGKNFRLWKFRTMVEDADARLSACLEFDPRLRAEWKTNHKLKHDPRITRIGVFLRKTSLDELPQLWNVVKGEMSLIGPRPIIQDEVKYYGSKWHTVSSVIPGMTGLWQVSGRSETGYHERVELDSYYIQNWSIWLDLYIVFKTAWIVVTSKGAY